MESQLSEPVALTGRFVVLEPLSIGHVDGLVAAASEDRSTYGFTAVPEDAATMAAYVGKILDQAARGEAVPFAQRRVADGRIVGATRFLDVRRWRGRPHPDEVEIGGTWLAASAQRTAVNTESKLLLLTHAFEAWQVVRVAIATDSRNARSRAAIARLGATFEGELRNHRWSYAPGEAGRPRTTAMFSIVPDEWPAVRAGLAARLDR